MCLDHQKYNDCSYRNKWGQPHKTAIYFLESKGGETSDKKPRLTAQQPRISICRSHYKQTNGRCREQCKHEVAKAIETKCDRSEEKIGIELRAYRPRRIIECSRVSSRPDCMNQEKLLKECRPAILQEWRGVGASDAQRNRGQVLRDLNAQEQR